MKTKPKDGLPAIEWEVDYKDQLSVDPEERESTYMAYGRDDEGRPYIGTAVFSCGELIRIDDPEPDRERGLKELAEYLNEQKLKYFGDDTDALGNNFSDADPGL